VVSLVLPGDQPAGDLGACSARDHGLGPRTTVATGEPVNFYTVAEAARRRGETALGYRITAEASEAGKSYGVHTNPKKSGMVTFVPEDKIIVIAED